MATASDPAPYLHSLKLSTPAPTSPTSTLLSTLITHPLTSLGHYTTSQISLVADLTRKNTHTITLTGLSSLLHHPSRTYGTPTALSTLFANITAQNQRINTNEPVLLIDSSTLSPTHLREVADVAANVLRDTHHIRPVRVYAGNFGTAAAAAAGGEEDLPEGYSLSLLNVVNTDIGGPGMVQLLDMVDWKGEGAVRVERWDGSGWNLVERQDFAGRDVEEEGRGSEMGASERGEWESEAEAEAEAEAEEEQDDDNEEEGEEDGAEPQTETDERDHVENVSMPDTSDAHQLADEPIQGTVEAAKETQADIEPEAARPQLRTIKHPSWEREQDSESLLDMIAKQSKRLPVSKSGNAYATAAAKETAGLEGEDEYQVL